MCNGFKVDFKVYLKSSTDLNLLIVPSLILDSMMLSKLALNLQSKTISYLIYNVTCPPSKSPCKGTVSVNATFSVVDGTRK
jgi:hypothetical protein